MTDKPIPEPVRLAFLVLEGYKADPEKHARLKAFLPALAMRLAKAGITVDLESLQAHVEKGFDHLDALAKSLSTRPAEPGLTYEAVKAALPPPKPRRAADDDDDDDDDMTLPAELAALITEGQTAKARAMLMARPALARAEHGKALQLAAAAGDLSLVRLIARRSPSTLKERSFEALALAAENGHLDVVKFLAEKAPDGVAAREYQALRRAAAKGHIPVVEFLATLDREGVRAHDYDAIIQAAGNGHLEMVKRLTALNWRGPRVKEFAAFRRAAGHGQMAVVQHFLAQFPEAVRAKDYVAIRNAAARGHGEMVDFLAGFLPKDRRGAIYDAFMAALQNGHQDLAKHIVKIEPDCLKYRGYRAIGHAADSNDSALIDYFLDLDPSLIKAGDYIALREAADGGHLELLKKLDAIDPAGVAARNHAALRGAVRSGKLETSRYLYARDPAGARSENFEAVFSAAEYAHVDILQTLTADFTADDWQQVSDVLRAGKTYRLKQMKDHPGLLLLRSLGMPIAQSTAADDARMAQMKTWQRTGLSLEQAYHLRERKAVQITPAALAPVAAMVAAEGYGAAASLDYAYRLVKLFHNEQGVLRYLQKWGTAGRAPLHDLAQAIVLPETVKTNLDWKSWGDAVLANGPAMAKLVKFAHRLKQPLTGSDGRWHLAETRAAVAKFSYPHGKDHPELAAFCLENELSESQFEKALAIVQRSRPPEIDRIPDATIKGEAFGKPGYVLRKLPRGDFRGLFLGELTDCCQSVGNAGGGCATHGYTSGNGGFYVVEKSGTGEIVAQCWAWRGTKGELVLDSLEALGDSASMKTGQWVRAVKALADQLTGSDVTALHAGQGGRTPDDAGWETAATAKPIDYDGYRDSGRQYLIWRNPGLAPKGPKA